MEEKIPVEILIEIVEKYKLGPVRVFTDPEIEKKLEGVESEEERIKILKNLPAFKLAEIMKDLEAGKISKENLKREIKERLNLDEFLSSKIAREIAEKFLGERTETPTFKEVKEKKVIKDIYREPIE